MKVVISGGGTGGHIFPAVAIANELKAQMPNAEILFVGALGKMEMEKVPKAGFNIVGLPIAGINRSNMLANLSFPFKLIKSLWKACKVLKTFKPDIAIGVGGFASGPTLMVSNMLGIKTLIQEQNSYPGITNKKLSKKTEKICVAYPNMDKYFDANKIVFTGNPVRLDILNQKIEKKEAKSFFKLDTEKKTILVIGGSLGAKSINEGILVGLGQFDNKNIQLIWQTGKGFVDTAQGAIKGNPNFFVSDFIYDMAHAYAAADLVISRAGALSVSELAIVAKPCVLVPYPFAAEDHQTKNAESLSTKNAAILIKDNEIPQILMLQVLELMDNETKLGELSENIRKFAKPLAAKEIVGEILKIVEI